MIETSENTLGGRIRAARIAKKIKLKELSAMLDITSSYLGMLERGKRVPSKRLLSEIANATDSSYDWLLRGTENDPFEQISAPSPSQTVASVDLKLLLTIIMSYLSYDNQLIAKFMGISPADVDKIISGEDFDFDFSPSWEHILSGLSMQLDLNSLVKKLDSLTSFFREKCEEKKSWALSKNLHQYISKNFNDQYQLADKIEYVDNTIKFDDETYSLICGKQIVFESETDGKLIFHYYASNMWLPSGEGVIETVLRSMEGTDCNKLSLILDHEDLYYQFCICYKALYDTADIPSDITPIISIIHIDGDTMEILDICTLDSDVILQDETSDALSQ